MYKWNADGHKYIKTYLVTDDKFSLIKYIKIKYKLLEWESVLKYTICHLKNTKEHYIQTDVFTDFYLQMGWILLNKLLNSN